MVFLFVTVFLDGSTWTVNDASPTAITTKYLEFVLKLMKYLESKGYGF